jgi:hypothetical protein
MMAGAVASLHIVPNGSRRRCHIAVATKPGQKLALAFFFCSFHHRLQIVTMRHAGNRRCDGHIMLIF